MIAFGPVPSRRLGRSLGINNVPPKTCPYACVYCQVGRTLKMLLERAAFYEPEEIFLADLNDNEAHIEEVADFLAQLKPATAYLSIPTRPPAEKWVQAPGEEAINRAYQILRERVGWVEYLVGYEGNAFAFTGNVEADLLNITAVHPMREDAVGEFLVRANAEWPVVHRLIEQGQLVETKYEGQKFYIRRLYAPT